MKFMESGKFVKGLIKYDFIFWYLLLLPNNKWAAFWNQGLGNCYSDSIMDGDYERGCAFIGTKEDTIEYILNSLHEMNLGDPLNFNFQIERIRNKLSVTELSEKSKPVTLPDKFWRHQ